VARKRPIRPDSDAAARSGLTQIMGDLEAEILECVWDLGSASVKDVHQCLLERREIAYTTVMTVMSRLTAKGLLVSHPVGRAYVYQAAAGREEFCAGVVRDFMSDMLAGADRAVLAQFVDSVTERDVEQLDLLAQIIAEKRLEASSSV
jgi:predicted transcriptional regulator